MSLLPWVNSLWRVPLILSTTALLASLSVLSSVFDGSGKAQHFFARSWGWFICTVSRVKVQTHGLEDLAADRGYVFMANHLSMFDHWAFLAKLPFQFRFVAKESLFHVPFLGWHLRRAGNIPVSRSRHRRTIRLYDGAKDSLRRGICFVIYPEGGRTWGEMRPFSRGSFLLPVRAEAPIVPVTILGAHKRLPRGSALIRPGVIQLIFHKPVQADEYSQMDLRELTQSVRDTIAASYREVE